jgi:hypothetical protein
MGWEWLSQLLQIISDILPRHLIVRTDERVVEFVFGAWPRVLQPGYYVEWPVFAKYEHVAIKRQVTSRSQRFGPHAYQWKAVYEISDALLLVTSTYDFEETIADFCEIAFSAMHRKYSSDEVFTVEARKCVLRKIRSQLSCYGVSIIDFSVVSQSTADRQWSIWELKPKE